MSDPTPTPTTVPAEDADRGASTHVAPSAPRAGSGQPLTKVNWPARIADYGEQRQLTVFGVTVRASSKPFQWSVMERLRDEINVAADTLEAPDVKNI